MYDKAKYIILHGSTATSQVMEGAFLQAGVPTYLLVLTSVNWEQ